MFAELGIEVDEWMGDCDAEVGADSWFVSISSDDSTVDKATPPSSLSVSGFMSGAPGTEERSVGVVVTLVMSDFD